MRRERFHISIVDKIVDTIMYASFLAMVLWGILKGIGIINTPEIVQQIPLISAGIGALSFAYKIGRFIERIEQRFVRHEVKFDHIEKDLEFLKSKA